MSQKAWERMGYAALAVTTFICTLIVIRWTIDFVSWASLDSGWAQAIGSIAAIIGSYFLGERQAMAALTAVAEADRIAVRRKNDAILALIDAAVNAMLRAQLSFSKKGFSVIGLHVNYDAKIMEGLVNALSTVPAYELGTFNSVAGFARLQVALFHFQGHVKRAEELVVATTDATTGCVPSFHEWNTEALHMCCEEAVKCKEILHQSL